jgi:hypothetical protein
MVLAAQSPNGLLPPSVVAPLPLSTRVLSHTVSTTSTPIQNRIVNGGQAKIELTTTPAPVQHPEHTIRTARLYVVLYAGGDRETYEQGNAAWSAQVKGHFVGVTAANVDVVLSNTVTLTIDQDSPEATFVVDPVTQFNVENHPFHSNSSSTKYESIRFDIDDPGGWTPSMIGTVNDAMRLSLRLDEHLVYDFAATVDAQDYAPQTLVTGALGFDVSCQTTERSLWVEGTEVELTWNLPTLAFASSFEAFEVEVLRLYNVNRQKQLTPTSIRATVDWYPAHRYRVPGNVRSVFVTPIDGSGYYAFRVRAISRLFDWRKGESRQVAGPWSESPTHGGEYDFSECENDFAITDILTNEPSHAAVFYFVDANRHIVWNHSLDIATDTVHSSIQSEQRQYLDVLGRPLQSLGRDNDNGGVVGQQIVYDLAGRPSLTTLASPVEMGGSPVGTVAFQSKAIRSGLTVYSAHDYDVLGTTYLTPTLVDNASPLSSFRSTDNQVLTEPSSGGLPFLRHYYKADGSLLASVLPGTAHRPTSIGSSPWDNSNRHLKSSVSHTELWTVFGSETPKESDVTKYIEISPDNVASATYVNSQGQVIATCVVGGSEIGVGQTEVDNGRTYITSDGTETAVLNLNGKHESAVRSQQERVNSLTVAEITVEGGVLLNQSTILASSTFALVNENTVKVRYHGQLSNPSHSLQLDNCLTKSFECNPSIEYRVLRTDLVPSTVAIAWRSVASATGIGEEFTLPAGEYRIERRVISPMENANGDLPQKALFPLQLTEPAVSLAIENLLADIFEESTPNRSSAERLAYYTSFRASIEDKQVTVPHPFPDPAVDLPCPKLVLPAPKDCDACPDGATRLETDTVRFAKYALDAYAAAGLQPPVSMNAVLFTVIAGSAVDKFDYGLPQDHYHDLNSMFKIMLMLKDENDKYVYDCRTMWLLWTQLIDNRVAKLRAANSTTPPSAPDFTADELDVLEQYLRILGKYYDPPPGGVILDLQFFNTASVESAFRQIRTPSTQQQRANDCVTLYTTLGVTDWEAVEACIGVVITNSDKQKLERGTGKRIGDLSDIGNVERLQKEILDDLQQQCTDRCSTLVTSLKQQIKDNEPWLTEADLFCRIQAAIKDCQEHCTLPEEPSEDAVVEFRKRLIGSPTVLSKGLEVPCPFGMHESQSLVTVLDMLIDYLNYDYDLRRRSAKTPICVNYAVVAYKFLVSAGWTKETMPVCIRNQALVADEVLKPELASDADCAAYENGGPNSFMIRVFEPHEGRFYRRGHEDCPNCEIIFEGYRKYPDLTHPWVETLNSFANDAWGRVISNRAETANTAHLLDSGEVRPILSYKSRTPDFVQFQPNWYRIDVDDSLRPLIVTTRQKLVDSSIAVNGSTAPLYTMNYGATGGGAFVSSPGIGWREPLQPAHGTLITYDGNAFRIAGAVDSAGVPVNPNDSVWRNFGPFGFQLRDAEAGPYGDRGPLFLWNLVPEVDDSGRVVSVSLQSIVNNVETRRSFPIEEFLNETPSFVDATFTSSIGHFFINDDQLLAYHDDFNNIDISIPGIRFFYRHTRTLLGIGVCPVDNICADNRSCAVCIEWTEPTEEDREVLIADAPLDCAGREILRIKEDLRAQYRRKIQEYISKIQGAVADKCDVGNINVAKLTVTFPQKYYHYTLYFYDRAGRLIRTVSPRGAEVSNSNHYTVLPAHTFVTRFQHDNQGRVRSKAAPDGGVTQYFYDRLGRLRFVQDERQASASPKRLSYVKYDAKSRATESGEVEYTGTLATLVASEVDNSAWPSGALARRDVVMYHYDQKVTSTTADAGWVTVSNETGLTQRNVRNRLSWSLAVPVLNSGASIATTPNVVRTFYSYDPHGNVVSEVYDIPKDATVNSDRIVKRLDYVWDLSTGNITSVDYQTQVVGENQPKTDRFQHRYTYDKNARLKYVETSRNGVIWERDAAYDYDRLGTLRRVTIGEDSVQGIDYTYTLLGDLKAINHPSLDPANDAGQDGTGTGANRYVAKDAFALGFSYHDGDFEKTVGSTPSPFNTNNTSFLKHEGTGLWSGFIGATTLHLAEITVPSGSTLMRNGALMGERLKYDRIGRLRVVTTYENVGNTWTSDATSGWSSSYMYDQNSNLTRVKRSEALSATPGLYDDVTIAPKDLSGNNSNVIDVVTDAGTNAVAGFTDLRTQTTAQNAVDVTGRVTTESNSGLARTNTWTSTDALSTATAGTTEARYLYDAAGNVVRVIVDNAGTDSTIYRIPSGGIADVATYKRVGNGNVVPMEWTIIGNGVIGVSRDVEDPETGPTFHRRVGTKLYALADHLGSIRAVVGDVKIPASGGTFTADVMAVYDYEAYGVPRPGLSLDVRAYWRYGFQGMLKQSELLGSTTDVSDYLTPFRSYDARSGRWRSHDPIFQPWESTYLGMGGNPAMMVDPWGLDGDTPEQPRGSIENPYQGQAVEVVAERPKTDVIGNFSSGFTSAGIGQIGNWLFSGHAHIDIWDGIKASASRNVNQIVGYATNPLKQLSADAIGLKDMAVSMAHGLVDDATIIVKNHPINILSNVIDGDYNAVAYNYGAFLSVGTLYIGGPAAAGRKAATVPSVRSAATTTAKETTKKAVESGVKKTAVQPSNLASATGEAAGKGVINGGTGLFELPKTLDVTSRQFGKKLGQKAKELGLDPGSSRDRFKLQSRIQRIFDNADEIRTNQWRGLGQDGSEGPALFFRRGRDVVVTSIEGSFVTLLKGGAQNSRFLRGRIVQ